MAYRAYIALLDRGTGLRGLWSETEASRRAVAQLLDRQSPPQMAAVWAVLDDQSAAEIRWDLDEGLPVSALRRLQGAAWEWGPLTLPPSFDSGQPIEDVADLNPVRHRAPVADFASAKKMRQRRDNKSKRW